MKQKATQRFMALEGLRALAAIVVVFYHALFMFYPMAVEGTAPLQHNRFEDNLFGSPLFGFISGGLAVTIFFVLSGFVLSIGYFKKGREESVRGQAVRRYLRLMIPSLAAILAAFALIAWGLATNASVGEVTRSSWLLSQWGFEPSVLGALYEGTIGIFLKSGSIYDPVLWTMYFEFLGSMIVFGFLLLFGKSQRRWLVYMLLIVLTFKTYFLCFTLGLMLADLAAQNRLPRLASWKGVALGLIGLAVGGVSTTLSGTLYQHLALPTLTEFEQVIWLRMIGATLIIFAILTTPILDRVFSFRWFSGLGRYTFSLYLVHKLVLFTFTGTLFLWFSQAMSYDSAVLLAFSLSIPVFIAGTLLFEKYVDQPSIRFSNQFATWYLEGHPIPAIASIRQRILQLSVTAMYYTRRLVMLIRLGFGLHATGSNTQVSQLKDE